MFREHTEHKQSTLFGVSQQLSETRYNELKESEEALFYELVFCQIPESEFAELYSDRGSRPNTPVNVLVGAEILKHANGWTDEQLMDHVRFDLKTRYALGMEDLAAEAFSPRTLYYFRKKLHRYQKTEGINLLERVFDHLTRAQLDQLEVETGIQRMDSFQAMSNIRNYTRLQLVVEVLQRVWRVMEEEDQTGWEDRVSGWVEDDSGTILYTMEPDEYESALGELGVLYRDLYESLKPTYEDMEAFGVFERVYHEQFAVVEDKVTVRESEDMDSAHLQSPDDGEATYRHKDGEDYRGQAVHVKETCDPTNDVQLINDVFVTANNVDDSVGLQTRLKRREELYEKAEQLHVDGGYGSEENDKLMGKQNLDIDMVQTGIRGRPPDVRIQIKEGDTGGYEVSCPKQTVSSSPTRTRHKAVFDSEVCADCPLREDCPTQNHKQGRVYYFDEAQAKRSQRLSRLENLPEERQTLRNNVEATVKQFTVGMNHTGKLRTRGRFKTVMYAICTAIGINLGRIHRYLAEDEGSDSMLKALSDLWSDLSTLWSKWVEQQEIRRFEPSNWGIIESY